MTISKSAARNYAPDKKGRGQGRRRRSFSEPSVREMQTFLVRYRRYGGRLSYFAFALALWHEFSSAGVRPPVLAKLGVYRRAVLAAQFAESMEALEERLGRTPRLEAVAKDVATAYFATDTLVDTAETQVRRLIKDALKDEYVAAFMEWYMEIAHGQPRAAE